MAHPAGGREGEEEQEEEEEEGKDPGLDSATIWSFDPRRLAAPKYHEEPVAGRSVPCRAGLRAEGRRRRFWASSAIPSSLFYSSPHPLSQRKDFHP